MKKTAYIFYLPILLLFISCIDEISLNVDADDRKIAVDGLISDEPDEYQIRLSYSSVLGQGVDIVQERIKGALVKVIDDEGNEVTFVEIEDGVYSAFLAAEVGRTYFTEINVEEKIIRSHPQVMLPRVRIDTIKYEIDDDVPYQNKDGFIFYKDEVVVKLNTTIDENIERPYLRWRTEGEFQIQEDYPMATSKKMCYVPNTVDFNTLSIFNTNNLYGNYLFDEEIVRTEMDFRFVWNYCFHIRQYSISEREYKYWDKIKELSFIEGSLFDPPPGRIIGNLYNVDNPNEYIAGYFSVASVSYKRIFLNRFDLDRKIAAACSTNPRIESRPECKDCLKFIGSTTQEPEYWRRQ